MNAPAPSAIIADDEPHLAEYLRQRLKTAWPELVIAGVARNGVEAEALLRTEAPDIAFLDIRMPGLTGIEVARRAAAPLQIVFVTAYDEYAIAAFEQAAVDYLLKPVTDERLQQTVARLKQRTDAQLPGDVQAALAVLARLAPNGASAATPERLVWIRASIADQVRLINVEDVCYFQSNDKYTSVFTAEGEALIRTPLKELGEQLDPSRFWQVHRGTIVNVAHVSTTTRDVTGRVSLSLKSRPERLSVSRAYAGRFKQ
ncbi:MAG TPA: LytTR family DNA-binding domain-containing protein, partial [Casimicrobiaceae bacterium]|nr:LytTR family DNA-binding domain-containing protein [Casimicrobiaceae bacterium]